jgi:hypothetical protein
MFVWLCSPVWVEDLQWTRPSFSGLYQICKRFLVSKVHSELEQARWPSPLKKKKETKKEMNFHDINVILGIYKIFMFLLFF